MSSSARDDRALLRAVVHGRVQGVGFRFFALDEAAKLGLTGYARNLSNGRSVEVVAEGPTSSLDALLASLRRGSSMSYVERVDASWGEALGEYQGFAVR
jgi:acylphosphatase